MTAPEPGFSSAMVREFRQAIERYCNRVNASTGVDLPALHIGITVASRVEVPDQVRRRVHQLGHQYVHRQLPRARVGGIAFPLDPRLPEPGFAIDIQPPTGDHPSALVTAVQPVAEPPVEPVGLALSYAGFAWTFRLFPADLWMPMGRWPGTDSVESAVRLPDFAKFVPRGELVHLRWHADRLTLRRSGARPEYAVEVDGLPLRAGAAPVVAGTSGSIAYRSGHGPETVLIYQLTRGGGG